MRDTLCLLTIMLVVLLSGLGVVTTKFMTRELFKEHQILAQEADALEVEWNQLLLEQGAWATNARIEQVAHGHLNLEFPKVADISVIE